MNNLAAVGVGICILAAGSAPAQDTQRQYLSGRGKDDAVPWNFFCTAGPQSGYWTNLPVPSNWELHGFGTPSYRKEPADAFAEQGRYKCDFTVPADWLSRRVYLVFEGVMTDTHAEVNGKPVGLDHQGSFYRFKYEVGKLLKFGATNRLEVLVHKRSANASVNRAERQGDYWILGGIFRPVYLEAVPSQFIERVAIDARGDGELALNVFLNGISDPGAGLALEAQVVEPDGKPVAPVFGSQVNAEQATLRAHIPLPRQWTAETPNLYRVEVRVKRGAEVIHRYSQKFGFRTMEVRDGEGLYVNGRRIILKGCDRHSFWPESGRCLSETVHRLDINLMKEMNMNAVRMSHYPPDEQFLDLCDELGLYVLDELGGWHWSYDTPTGRGLIQEMVTRDVNHPCILFWDNGNEGGWNTELDGDFAKWDPQQRRVLHPWTTFSGINATHYPTYERARAACEGTPMYHLNKGEHNPQDANTNAVPAKVIFMPTEFLHGLYDGGAGTGMEDYWELMRQSKFIGGGFVWAFLDEGLRHPDTGEIDVAGNQAPDGIVGPHREKEASFYTLKEVWSPIVLKMEGATTTLDSPTFFLKVENRYSFVDAQQCGFTWQLRGFSKPEDTAAGHTVLAEGKIDSPSIPPGGQGTLSFKLPDSFRAADALAIRVDDPQGRELWTPVYPLPRANNNPYRVLIETPAAQAATVTQTSRTIDVNAGGLAISIDKQTGLLANVKRGRQSFSLTNGPRPAIGTARLTSLEASSEGQDCVVSAKFEGSLESVTWRIRANGWLQCAYSYVATGSLDFHGVLFDYPEQLVKKKRWLGDGPYRVWKNRLRGVTLDVWENEYNNTIAGWRDWVYPEFKGCFANVHWLQLETSEGRITAVPQRNDQFIQILTPEFPPEELALKALASVPKAGLAFLGAIPPMGNKFHLARDTGPQGQPNVGTGLYSGAVDFYFGISK